MLYLQNEEYLYHFLKKEYAMHDKKEADKALENARSYHKGQERVGGLPYIVHPMFMAYYAWQLGIRNDEMLSVILLHDTVEDCRAEAEELSENKVVQNGIRCVTYKKIESLTRKESRHEYFQNLKNNREAVITKGLDRYHNLLSAPGNLSSKSLKRIMKETEEEIYPILETGKKLWPEYRNVLEILLINLHGIIESIRFAFN